MESKLNPYLNFDGKTKDAMEFYKNALGGELTMSTFKDGGMSHGAEDDSKIMHAQLISGNLVTIMASDLQEGWSSKMGDNVSLSLSGTNDEELTKCWNMLSEGGVVAQPLVEAPWGDKFGMFTDKFGIRWMVNIAGKKA